MKIVESDIATAYQILEDSYKNGGKLLVAGNGGSAADAEHIVGELMKGFKLPRKSKADFAEKLIQENAELGVVLAENLQGALPAIALDGHPALSTAYMNDCEPLHLFCATGEWLWQERRCISGHFKKWKQQKCFVCGNNCSRKKHESNWSDRSKKQQIGTDERCMHQSATK